MLPGRKCNFNAGPAVLPEEVLLEAQADLVNYKGKGLSVMEMSHRSKEFQAIFDDAVQRAKRLMNLGDDYEVLFLQGGASTQFLMLPMNLCHEDQEANYIDTGSWSVAAIKEPPKIGKKVHVAATSKEAKYSFIPREFTLSPNPAYLHITTNNTIDGNEFHFIPEAGNVPLIADMSSNFLSKPMDFHKFSLIYAGAQKNIGPAGTTFVAIRKDLREKFNKGLPAMLDYNNHIDKDYMFNTPCCWAIYMVGLVLKWIEDKGGLEWVAKNNQAKAKLIYDVLDASKLFRGTVVPADRSLMNIPFRLSTEELEAKFISEASAAGMIGLKGHKSVGGCRASLYNYLPMEAAERLARFMVDFEKANA
jgi:phosphoserine aminotransferase